MMCDPADQLGDESERFPKDTVNVDDDVGMNLADIVQDLRPQETVVLLGAGASVPSGGRTAQDLAQHLCQTLSAGAIDSDDLSEACSLLEDRYGRAELIKALATDLKPLSPDGGLQALMDLDWARVYTTNYDQLVEQACAKLGKPVEVIRTNLDFRKLDHGKFELLKIHGCITRDRGFGHADSMILTEQDYLDYDEYREGLFAKLTFDLHTKNLLIIGQSLKDRHLRDLVDKVASLAKKQGTANSIRILVYSADPGRMQLLIDRNLKVAAGSVTQFMEAFETTSTKGVGPVAPKGRGVLPRILLNRTIDIDAEVGKPANAVSVAAGGAAAYADIVADMTFRRTFEELSVGELEQGKIQFLTIVGASGVGKTTGARRILLQLRSDGHRVYEHISEFCLAWEEWAEVASVAKKGGRRIFLLIDDAFKHLAGINRLANRLADEGLDSLSLILTAHSASWNQRSKTGVLRRLGKEIRLEKLDDREISALVHLVRSNSAIKALLEKSSASLSREEQVRLVKQKSTADMFVALKYLFATDSLDEIILAEFADLDDDVQEIYKVASLFEATYASASRQMILEVLDLDWSDIPLVLARTKGVLQQREIDRRNGLFVWRTRHPVIAQVISRYKYADEDELYFILSKVIDTLNSAMLLDRQAVPNLCDSDWGIDRVSDFERRAQLLEKLCARSSNRVPWHRLISLWFHRDPQAAEMVIRRAIAAVGHDSPIARYQVKVTLAKAEKLRAIGAGDEVALIFSAETLAKEALKKWPDNKYSYLTLMDVGEALQRATGSSRVLEDVIDRIDVAYDEILDDQLLRWRQRAESLLQT